MKMFIYDVNENIANHDKGVNRICVVKDQTSCCVCALSSNMCCEGSCFLIDKKFFYV